MPKRQRISKYDSTDVQGEGSWVKVSQLTVAEMREARAFKGDDDFEHGIQLISAHTMEWNWVDDDGKPLPQPQDHPEVMEHLTSEESTFLALCIRGTMENVKN